jgi:hypothetical protein
MRPGCRLMRSPSDFLWTTNLLKMEMDLATAVFASIALSLCALPFIVDHRSRALKWKRLLAALQGIAKHHHGHVDQHEICSEVAVGLDTKHNALYFASKQQQGITTQHADLTEIRACQVLRATRSGQGRVGEVTIERVELCFLPKEKGRSEIRFILFHDVANGQLNGESQFADKWATLITDRLKHRTH